MVSQEPAPGSRGGLLASGHDLAERSEPMMTSLIRLALRRAGWHALVVVVQRAQGQVTTSKLPSDLPLSVRRNTDGSVGITVGHDDDGEALLADLRRLMGGGDEHPLTVDTRA